jgi:hypothetical protein
VTFGIDTPGTRCAFGAHCTVGMLGHGGFDEHHELPLSLTGAPDGVKLILCPNHHRRQHALVRYVVETGTGVRDQLVLRHFAPIERSTAEFAYDGWVAAGSPHVSSWPCPAARP